MKNAVIIVVVLGTLCFVTTRMIHKRPVLKCPCEKELLDSIKQIFDADSVFLGVGYSPEIPHQPEIKSIDLTIINGTADAVDLKTYVPVRIEEGNLLEIDNALKKEADPIARLLFERCNSQDFNTIVIYFSKYDKQGNLMPIYQFWYHKELFPEKWKDL